MFKVKSVGVLFCFLFKLKEFNFFILLYLVIFIVIFNYVKFSIEILLNVI